MLRQHQTKFGMPSGNCFATCVACIFDEQIDDVPNFIEEERWFDSLNEWLAPKGYTALCLLAEPNQPDFLEKMIPNVLCIVSGPGPRGIMHAVIYRGGEMVHDPHPSGEGLSGPPEDYIFFIKNDPSSDGSHDLSHLESYFS